MNIPGCSSNCNAINEEEDPSKDSGSSSDSKSAGTMLLIFNLLSIIFLIEMYLMCVN